MDSAHWSSATIKSNKNNDHKLTQSFLYNYSYLNNIDSELPEISSTSFLLHKYHMQKCGHLYQTAVSLYNCFHNRSNGKEKHQHYTAGQYNFQVCKCSLYNSASNVVYFSICITLPANTIVHPCTSGFSIFDFCLFLPKIPCLYM